MKRFLVFVGALVFGFPALLIFGFDWHLLNNPYLSYLVWQILFAAGGAILLFLFIVADEINWWSWWGD